VDIVQAVGRALRPAPKKKFGYVIVPAVHEKNAKSDDIFDSNSFKEVLTTLRALGTQDDDLVEYFRLISQGKRPRGRRPFEDLLTEKLAAKINLKEFVKSVELRCWDRLAKLSWRPFEEARLFSQSLKLKSSSEWSDYCSGEMSVLPSLPSDIPRAASEVYKNSGWVSWGDWLGSGNIAPRWFEYLPFNVARSFARKLGIQSTNDWEAYCKGKLSGLPKKPINIPHAPSNVYKNNGWSGMGDWLGTNLFSAQYTKLMPFKNARKFVHSLKLKSSSEWRRYCKGQLRGKPSKPPGIPVAAPSVYKKKGWISMGDWLGTRTPSPYDYKYLEFRKARAYVRELKLTNLREWQAFACDGKRGRLGSRPPNIPSHPQIIYKKKGWIGYGDWLGNGYVATTHRNYMPFKAARSLVRKKRLKTNIDFRNWHLRLTKRCPAFIYKVPRKPQGVYQGKGWKGWENFLGKQQRYWPFNKARAYVRKLRLKNTFEWRDYVKSKITSKGGKPKEIPANPFRYKGAGWNGYPDFLGTGRRQKS